MDSRQNVVLEDVTTGSALGEPGQHSLAWGKALPQEQHPPSALHLTPGSPRRRGMDRRKALSLIYV